ncbi:hypothetical protein HanRHA438_Chr08g0360391 [Helianthus annuus]|nr:hypothetical protein HanRHA438_Chr08g0360391 [Helianthus annuus]
MNEDNCVCVREREEERMLTLPLLNLEGTNLFDGMVYCRVGLEGCVKENSCTECKTVCFFDYVIIVGIYLCNV